MPKHRPRKKTARSKKYYEPVFVGAVRDLTSDGLGVIGHPDGRTFFVSGVFPGEEVEILPTGRRGKAFVGELKRVVTVHPQRRVPPCSLHGISENDCGGCPWMFMTYEAQVAAKMRRVHQALSDLVTPHTQVDTLVLAPTELGYRNRAQFKTDGARLGYVAAGTHNLVDVAACPVLSEGAARHLTALRRQLPNPAWRVGRGRAADWRTLAIDDAVTEPALGRRLGFRQGNTAQNAHMQQWLAETIEAVPADASVLELFAGNGNFTRVLTQHFIHVVAVEGDTDAAARLQDELGSAVTVESFDLFSPEKLAVLTQTYAATQVLLMDPPRSGLPVREPLVEGLRDVHSLVYISCNLATWRRDCRDFMAAGFELTRVTPLDMFPHTPHIEILSVLVRG